MFQHFKWSFLVTILGLTCGFLLGGVQGFVIVGILAVLETSLSFDNAVANAKVLQTMDEVWRHRFLTWGMPVAVVGMRLIFPLLIVGVIAKLWPWEVLVMAAKQPDVYAAHLKSAHHQVAAFGGTFLMMVFLKFFFDEEKDSHWLKFIEEPLQKLGRLDMAAVAVTLIAVVVCASFTPNVDESFEFLKAAALGLVAYIAADGVGAVLEGDGESVADSVSGGISVVARQGVGAFLYLEMLDSSFSFDGVIGAFALSNNLFIIAIGLGVGAMFVRSMTLVLVAKGTLQEFQYLEHGAFWAIGALATIMFVGVHVVIPEVVTGGIGAALIGLAIASSIRENRKEALA